MIRGMFQNSSYFTQLVITLSVAFLMNIFGSFLAAAIAMPLFHLDTLDFNSMLSNLDDPRNIAILKVFQIILSLFGFAFSALVLAYLFSFGSGQYLYMEYRPAKKVYLYAILLVIVVFPFINFIGEINSRLALPDFLKGFEGYLSEKDETNEKLMESFLSDSNLAGLFVNIVMIGIIPAVGEELFFRGILQHIFSKMTKSHHWGIWITAAVFSLVHTKIYTFLPIMVLGAMFGYMLVWSRSIWVPVLAHLVNNSVAVIMYYFVNSGKINEETLDYGAKFDVWPISVISAVLTGVLLFTFFRNAEKPAEESQESKTGQES